MLLCGLSLLILLGGCSIAQAGVKVTPTAPALDAASQRYLDLLESYYVPLAVANDPAQLCVRDVAVTDPTMTEARFQLMLTCRPPMVTELSAAQTFDSKLLTATPPARWQAQDTALKQAIPVLITVLTAQIAAIDAQSVAQFLATIDSASQSITKFQDPIVQINLQSHVGRPPHPSALPVMGSRYG
jgi:hypothetical protein